MKHCLCLLLACLLLCGCTARELPEESQPETAQTVPAETVAQPLYAPGHPLEQSAPGALRAYPLSTPARKILAAEQGILLLSGEETTDLTLLTGEELTPAASISLPFLLSEEDPSLRVNPDTISYFDPIRQETVVLSGSLKEISRIPAPEGTVGSPILSADRNTLFYFTATALRAWDLETGIRRCVKEMDFPLQELTGLHQSDSIVQCRVSKGEQERTLFLAADTGRTVAETSGGAELYIQGDSYFALVPEGAVDLPLFGKISGETRLLTPEDIYGELYYLENQNCVVSVSSGGELNCYDLNSGLRTSTLTLENMTLRSVIPWGENAACLLLRDGDGNDLLCRWELDADICRTGDSRIYTGPRYTAEAPDTAALAECHAQAAQIGEKYGIRVLVGEEPISVMPWDYVFETEYLAPVLRRELSDLDARLSDYPQEIFDGIRAHFSSLTICIVREICGSAESGSVAAANGVQFFQGSDAYIAIAAGQYSQRALYHELYHVMETRLLTDSAAFNRWEDLNPAGFTYDLDYTANAHRDGSEYLQPETRSFVDTYSMSFPKEDRARILERAMEQGNEALFASPAMQAKLSCLCQAIREAYGLKKSPETFRWEQYLKN